MIYVYCRRPSDSARELVKALDATRLRNFDGQNFWRKNRRIDIKSGDIVICWGDSFPAEIEGVRILNAADVGNKLEAATTLRVANVNTIHTVTVREYENAFGTGSRGNPSWIGRTFNHYGGNDILAAHITPDYYVKKIALDNEYRVHSFLGKSIRAGKKTLREGFSIDALDASMRAHPWCRSYDGGWRVVYDNFQSKSVKGLREIAHNAVKALKLDFGAVDVGQDRNGTLYVLEVNRGPGLEGGSITAYINHIKEWIANNDAGRTEAESDGAEPEQVRPVRVEEPPLQASTVTGRIPLSDYAITIPGNTVDSRSEFEARIRRLVERERASLAARREQEVVAPAPSAGDGAQPNRPRRPVNRTRPARVAPPIRRASANIIPIGNPPNTNDVWGQWFTANSIGTSSNEGTE